MKPLNKKIFSNFNFYLIVFTVLLYIFLILLTLYVNKKIYALQTTQSIWCFDDWRCDINTEPSGFDVYVDPCYNNGGKYAQTGLSSCLYGYGSTLTSQCYSQVCTCPSTLSNSNCIAGCIYGRVNDQAQYCCFTGGNNICEPPSS